MVLVLVSFCCFYWLFVVNWCLMLRVNGVVRLFLMIVLVVLEWLVVLMLFLYLV